MIYYNNSNIKKLYYEILLLNFSGILISLAPETSIEVLSSIETLKLPS